MKTIKNKIDVIIDSDAYNEIDDQFAISYLFANSDKLNTVAIYAAPFSNTKTFSPEDGMEKSYNEIIKLINLAERYDLLDKVYKGSTTYLADENTPVISEASLDLSKRAMNYTKDNPLYIVSIGSISNIASALLIEPKIADRIVLVWLGGHGLHYKDTKEYNMRQDYSASRIVMSKVENFVQLPCLGVVSQFTISKQELQFFLENKNKLADYLAKNTIQCADSYAIGTDWTRVIWDVTAVAYLLNEDEKFMCEREEYTYLPNYQGYYENEPIDKKMKYVYFIKRDCLMNDLINKLINFFN